jgi:hypothetical protein
MAYLYISEENLDDMKIMDHFAQFQLCAETEVGSWAFGEASPNPRFEAETTLNFLNKTLGVKPIEDSDLKVQLVPLCFDLNATLDSTVSEDDSSFSIPNESPGFNEIKSLLTDTETTKTFEESDSNKKPQSLPFALSKKRKDVLLKTVLRKCRKFLQQSINQHTGFVCSKKAKSDDPLYECLQKFSSDTKEFEPTHQSMDILFYLGALLYPQDTKRNVMKFGGGLSKKQRLDLIQKVHDVLYKYSHEKLDYFCNVPALAFLFKHYYENVANGDKDDAEYFEAMRHVIGECNKTLKKFGDSI